MDVLAQPQPLVNLSDSDGDITGIWPIRSVLRRVVPIEAQNFDQPTIISKSIPRAYPRSSLARWHAFRSVPSHVPAARLSK
jgi:hypothetical protein